MLVSIFIATPTASYSYRVYGDLEVIGDTTSDSTVISGPVVKTDKLKIRKDSQSAVIPGSKLIYSGTFVDSNPIIGPKNVDASETNPDAADAQYAPAVAKSASDTYWMFVKSDEIGQKTVYAIWTSRDAINWDLHSDTVATEDVALNCDELRNPHLTRHPTDGTWSLYYRCKGGTDGGSIGHAVADSPLGFTDKSTTDTDVKFYSETDFSNALAPAQSASAFLALRLDDLIWDGEKYIYYFSINRDATSISKAFSFTGTGSDSMTIGSEKILTNPIDWPRSGGFTVGMSVYRFNSAYFGTIQVGTSEPSGDTDQRETYAMVGDGRNFEPVTNGLVVNTGDPGTWREKQAYGGEWLTKQGKNNGGWAKPLTVSDSYIFYFNGQDSTTQNTGSIGIKKFQNLPTPSNLNTVEKNFVSLNNTSITTSSTSPGNNTNIRMILPREPPRIAKLFSYSQNSGTNDDYFTSIATISDTANLISEQKCQIKGDGSGSFFMYTSDICQIDPLAFAVNKEMWVNGGTAESLASGLIFYDSRVHPEIR